MFELVNNYCDCINKLGCIFCDEYCDSNEDTSCMIWDECNPFSDIIQVWIFDWNFAKRSGGCVLGIWRYNWFADFDQINYYVGIKPSRIKRQFILSSRDGTKHYILSEQDNSGRITMDTTWKR